MLVYQALPTIPNIMQSVDYPLLTKHYQGICSTEEDTLVAEWRIDNENRYYQFKKIWAMSYDIPNKKAGFDVSETWRETSARARGRLILQQARATTQETETKVIDLQEALRNKQAETETKILPLNAGPQKQLSPPIFKKYAIAATVSAVVLAGGVYGTWFYNPILTEKNEGNSPLTVVLKDGTKVTLQPRAALNYPRFFDAQKRVVSIIGEASFDVARNMQHPFHIDAGGTNVDILGTSFAMKITETTSEIAVESGKVGFSDKATGFSVKLAAGEKAVFKGGKIEVLPDPSELNFDEKTIAETLRILSSFYQKPIEVIPSLESQAKNCRLSASFEGFTFEETLEVLVLLLNAEIEQTSDKVLIKSFNCDLKNTIK